MLFLLLFIWIAAPMPGQTFELVKEARSAVLINAESGAILWGKEEHERHPPASMIKVATALYALEALEKNEGSLDTMVTASRDALATITPHAKWQSEFSAPSHLLETDTKMSGIKIGERLQLKHFLFSHMVASGGDASNVMAEHISGAIPKFVQEVNGFLRRLGMKKTTVTNPHGLHHPQQLSTAYETALIMREALKNPLFVEMIELRKYTRPQSNKQDAITVYQTNKLITRSRFHDSRVVGGKTGYHSHAGHNLVAFADDGHRQLIGVVMGCESSNDKFANLKELFDEAFDEEPVHDTYLEKGMQRFAAKVPGATEPVKAFLGHPLVAEYYPSEKRTYKAHLVWDDLHLPIDKGERIGEVSLVDKEGVPYRTETVYAAQTVQPTLFYQLTQGENRSAGLLILSSVFFFVAFLSIGKKR